MPRFIIVITVFALVVSFAPGGIFASGAFGGAAQARQSDNQDKKPEREKSNSSQGISNDADERRERAQEPRKRREYRRPRIGRREYRTYDGASNNIEHPRWGASFIQLQRLGAPDYGDGISTLAGPLRPSARLVSNNVLDQAEGVSIPNEFGASAFVWQWGQFLDHDIDLTDGGTDEAANIKIPAGDRWFDPSGNGAAVIPFNRANYDPLTGTDLTNPRQQENEITSWIDASNIYGSDETRAAALRVGPDSPFLKTSDGNLLPFNLDNLSNANGFVSDPTSLFLAGDVRANEQIGLTVMHTLFMREHNRLAAKLQRRYGGDPELIFQTARRLVIAEIQMITYNEFLPALLGSEAIKPYRGYDSSINPSIYNEFSGAAYRLGHSMIGEDLLRLNKKGGEIRKGHLDLRGAFFTAPHYLKQERDIDPILRGLAGQAHQKIDVKIVSDLRNFLFGDPGAGGLDLAALNLQRGRDHGIGSYNDMRESMGLPRITSFAQITSDTELQQALYQTYGSVDDIDLWVGGLAEDPMTEHGSQLGPLCHAMLVHQFTELRDGDRFWYQRDLTRFEKRLVRNTTLARVIRRNTGIGKELQANVFYVKNDHRREH